jgi:hypothetical protein
MSDSTETSPLVINKDDKGMVSSVFKTCKKHKYAIAAMLVLVVILIYMSHRSGFTGGLSPSADGVVAGGGPKQLRTDATIDKGWNLSELEKTVASINSS